MRDYITTVFNLIVGLVNADKIVYLALIGLGIIVIWQLLSLLTNFHRRFAWKCRKISKFLTTNGLSANNYNNFLALIAKMPQEFIRGYKTFEHASYGLPSDYIKRFDSIDVEVNGGLHNHGKSLVKAAIYCWTIILFVLSLALLGSDTALTGFAFADALLVPILFLILAKGIYFIFNAIKQQQYKMAVDEFNEMLDIMDDKIENNDNLPGPDVLTDLIDSVPVVENAEQEQLAIQTEEAPELVLPIMEEPTPEVVEPIETNDAPQEDSLYDNSEEVQEFWEAANVDPEIVNTEETTDVFTEEELLEEVGEQPQDIAAEMPIDNNENTEDIELNIEETADVLDVQEVETPQQEVEKAVQETKVKTTKKATKPKQNKEESKEEEMEEKRGRGRPKKVAEGELVIKTEKQFEEVLQRAEKLMRKSEEALSSSQAKRVEKSLKELIDAMTKYKEEH